MKKLYTTLMMAMMAMLTLSLTSCETDEQIAYTLEGTWTGDMSIEDWDGYSYVSSEITFLKDPYTYSEGSGLWVDYYDYRGYVPTHFNWVVEYGTIYIHFIEDNWDVEIRHYTLSDNHFRGRFYDGDKEVRFDLFNSLRRYENSYDWDYWGGSHYYTRGAVADSTTISRPRHRIKELRCLYSS